MNLDAVVIRGLFWVILLVASVLISFLYSSINGIRHEYVEPTYIKHKSNKERYRKYIIACDKKGKPPLSYKQWKFAYPDKTPLAKYKPKKSKKKEVAQKQSKTYGWQYWE